MNPGRSLREKAWASEVFCTLDRLKVKVETKKKHRALAAADRAKVIARDSDVGLSRCKETEDRGKDRADDLFGCHIAVGIAVF